MSHQVRQLNMLGEVLKEKPVFLVRHRVPMLSLQDVFSKEEVSRICGINARNVG